MYDFPAEITIGGSEILEVKKEQTILGIKVQEDLKWQSQFDEMVKRATSITWALRRMRATLVEYWKAGVRLPSLALRAHFCPVSLTGQGPADCHGCHNWQMGAFTYPSVA